MHVSRINHRFMQCAIRPKFQVKRLPELIERMSQLLQEGYTFADCITMLLPYHVKDCAYWQELVDDCFQKGQSVTFILRQLGVKSRFLIAIQLAEATGQLANTLQIIAQQMRFQEKMKLRFTKILLYPALLFTFIISLFIAFRLYFLPTIEQMLYSRTIKTENTTIQWTRFFLHVPDYIIISAFCLIVITVIASIYIRHKRVDLQLYILLKIPILSYFWTLLMTRRFARSLGDLLVSGMSLQQSLHYLEQQDLQPQLSYIAKRIGARIIYGDSLAQTVLLIGFFLPRFEQFIEHGEKSGLLGRELLIYAELLDQKLENIIHNTMQLIQPILFLIIAACIIAAYLSILLPMYKMLEVI
ncbi:competence type IV pilus assembly protein ComGB [Metasolibacillus fluoroglycofenilyticus]|uniref:competence type IV pilus assembly protein ComGB n=1 Tax=Metasolibacillus fluoroglycofenilyticus TaxID=1239396 RepID=UPI001379CEA5|nr:competence type IV pilus assembly protein ComGB [Metasolibacillus fluoroglycofenilyticus]